MRPQVGNVIHNKYRLLRLIGDGGMGSVYEARHEVLGTTVALKFLHAELTRRPGLVQRFLQEARVSAQIQSPNVVRVTDVDQTPNGLAFIVMELLDGRTLQALYEELYKNRQRLSYADALEYAIQMLDGVSAAHKTGIVHRDLKPDNVMITKGPRGEPVIKLLDFGIAKLRIANASGEPVARGLTRPGVIMGTPEYMAPEQAYSADAVDSRADIFSLGVIIFEMLAGRRPVGGDEPQQIASAYLSGQVAELTELFPECPAELARAVHKAMAPLAKDRFPSADAFREQIEPFWLAIRPPPSVHASLPSISFARLTPVPSPEGSSAVVAAPKPKPAPASPHEAAAEAIAAARALLAASEQAALPKPAAVAAAPAAKSGV
ncbi:MAG TPA: serine/threonine-protein kinase, partial [Minicystis sp.]|nr:serine/threonine-protein kinase [Minicystis sp.]